jgi:hypothetical protein
MYRLIYILGACLFSHLMNVLHYCFSYYLFISMLLVLTKQQKQTNKTNGSTLVEKNDFLC